MNKNELVSIVADKLNMTRAQTEDVIDTFLDTIQETLSKDEKVVVSGFGTFEVRTRVARSGRNPRTGEEINIPELKTPAFKAGKVLKDNVR